MAGEEALRSRGNHPTSYANLPTYGQEDKMEGFSDPATGEKLAAELKAAGNAAAECFIYPG